MASTSLNRWMDESRKLQWDRHKIAKKSVELAGDLLMESQRFSRGSDKHVQSLLSAFAKDASTRDFVRSLLHDVFPCSRAADADSRLADLLAKTQGIPSAFGRMASIKVSFLSFSTKGKVESLRGIINDSIGAFLVPLEGDAFARRLKDDKNESTQSSLRLLSRPVMGTQSARAYVISALEHFKNPAAFAIELDLNALCYQSNLYHFDHSVALLKVLLKPLFDASVQSQSLHPLVLAQGGSLSLPVAVAAIKELLQDQSYDHIDLCLELPAYLPSVEDWVRDLSDWAAQRCEKTSSNKVFRSALKLRLVKGESLETEQLVALRNRRQDSLSASKMETDSRYKLLMQSVLQCQGLEPIFATHNLFDIAYALLTWARARRTGAPRFSLLRGISMPLVRCLLSHGFTVHLESCLYNRSDEMAAHQLLLDFVADMARAQSVLCLPQGTTLESAEWIDMAQKFSMSSTKMEGLQATSPAIAPAWLSSINELATRREMEQALKDELSSPAPTIPSLCLGSPVESQISVRVRNLYTGEVDYSYTSLQHEHTRQILDAAKKALPKIEGSLAKRCELVSKLGLKLEQNRVSLMAKLVRFAGFTLADADAELGQAISYCRHYVASIKDSGWKDGSKVGRLGVVVVAPSHQSPLADAVEGVITAWIAGSCIIYQAATNALPLGVALQQCFEEAGMKSPFLQLAICLDNQFSESLVQDEAVSMVASYTDPYIMDASGTRPLTQRSLSKPKEICSVLIAADADWQRALLESLASFTRRSAQLASTPHALIVEAPIYDSSEFQEALKDAFSSIELNDCRELRGDFGPLCQPLSPDSVYRLCILEKGESWLLGAPQMQDYRRAFCAPICRLGVVPESPVLQMKDAARMPHLSILRAADAAAALEMQGKISINYRAAIYTKSDSLIERWRKHMPVAQAFINTPPVPCLPALMSDSTLTQAWGASGGSGFVPSLCPWQDQSRPQLRSQKCQIPFTPWEMITPRPTGEALMRLRAAADSISLWWEKEYGIRHRLADIAGEWTELRYDPRTICIRAEKSMSDVDLCILLMVALKAGGGVELSMSHKRNWAEGRLEPLGVKLTIENRTKFEARIPSIAQSCSRLRDVAATDSTRLAAREAGLSLMDAPVMANGRIELLRVCRERSTCCCE